MRKLVFALAALATVGVAAPASAQFYVGGDGLSVGIGDRGWSGGPRYGHRWGGAYAYDRSFDDSYAFGGCRVIKVRQVLPDGSVVIRRRSSC